MGDIWLPGHAAFCAVLIWAGSLLGAEFARWVRAAGRPRAVRCRELLVASCRPASAAASAFALVLAVYARVRRLVCANLGRSLESGPAAVGNHVSVAASPQRHPTPACQPLPPTIPPIPASTKPRPPACLPAFAASCAPSGGHAGCGPAAGQRAGGGGRRVPQEVGRANAGGGAGHHLPAVRPGAGVRGGLHVRIDSFI